MLYLIKNLFGLFRGKFSQKCGMDKLNIYQNKCLVNHDSQLAFMWIGNHMLLLPSIRVDSA